MEDDDADLTVHTDKGIDISKAFDKRSDKFEAIWDNAEDAADALTVDVSERTLLKKLGWNKPTTAMDKLVEWDHIDAEDAEYAENSSSMNNIDDDTWENYGGDEFLVKDPRGYKFVLNGMMQDLKKADNVEFNFNYDVQNVNYTPGSTGVSGVKANGTSFDIKADAVVSSVSIGVLNADDIKWQPALPDWKKKAFSQFTMGLEDKIFVSIPKTATWVPKGLNWAIASDKVDYYPEWENVGSTDTHNIFLTFAVMKEGKRLELEGENAVKTILDEVEVHFKKAYGKAGEVDVGQFRPDDAFATSWFGNKHFKGSYSFMPVHSMENVSRADLINPLTGLTTKDGFKTLYFTGEALDLQFSGFVHGGLSAGEMTGNQIFSAANGLVEEILA
jgi:polyamine oxidase